MKISIEGMIEIGRSEALCQSPYLDSGGVKTIGIGSTVSEVRDIDSIPWGTVWTIPKCFEVYQKSLKKYEDAVNKGLKVVVEQYQFDALVSFIYNVGVGGIKSTLFKRINAGPISHVNTAAFDESVRKAFLMWVNDNGKKVQGLVNRRTDEYNLFISGKYKSNGCISVFPCHPVTHKPHYSRGTLVDVRPYFILEPEILSEPPPVVVTPPTPQEPVTVVVDTSVPWWQALINALARRS